MRAQFKKFGDNISGLQTTWTGRQGLESTFIQPDNPQLDAHIEHYNRRIRYD